MEITCAISRASRFACGSLLCASLFYAPWDFGATSVTAIRNLNWGLGTVFLLWVLSLLLGGRRTRETPVATRDSVPGYKAAVLRFPSSVLLLLSFLLLLLGWGMALNAHAIADIDYEVFLPLTSPMPKVPGTVDYALSIAFMVRTTALLGCVWVGADLVRDPRWLMRLWWALGLAGGSLALLGLFQKASGAEMIFWLPLDPSDPPVSTFFATYYYHGNAGAYLNLALPAVLGLAYRYATRPSNPGARALWIGLLVIMVVAVMSDTSRMGQAIAGLIVLVFLCSFGGSIARRLRGLELKTALTALVVGVAALWAITQASHLDLARKRWDAVETTVARDARWQADAVAMSGLPQAGPLGFGAGTFSVAFPYLNRLVSKPVEGDWLFLHNDYLQTLLEWGWLGGLLWALLFFGGMLSGLRDLTSKARSEVMFPRQKVFLTVALIALIGVALHAAVDFPLQIASIQLYAAVWVGVCWGLNPRKLKVEIGSGGELKAESQE